MLLPRPDGGRPQEKAILDKSDLFSPFDDGCAAPKVGVSGCDVVNALMVTLLVVMIDEGADLVF
jgi:hypothetical protein